MSQFHMMGKYIGKKLLKRPKEEFDLLKIVSAATFPSKLQAGGLVIIERVRFCAD